MTSAKRGVRTSASRPAPGIAVSVRTDDERLYVTLDDGREVDAPLTERLREATERERAEWSLTGFGTGIRWEALDEDVGVAHLLGLTEDEVFDYAGFRSDPNDAGRA